MHEQTAGRPWYRAWFGELVGKYGPGFLAIFSVLAVERILFNSVFAATGSCNTTLYPLGGSVTRWVILFAGGALALGVHALSWFFFEKRMKTEYGPGGWDQPKGREAVAYGITISIGLYSAASIAQLLVGIPRVQIAFHWPIWIMTIVISTPAYLLVYGFSDSWRGPRWRGIRRILLDSPWPRSDTAKQTIILFAYTGSISTLTVGAYRLLSRQSQLDRELFLRILVPFIAPFTLGTLLMLIWPNTAKKGKGGDIRGYVVATTMMIALYASIYSDLR